MSTQVIVILCKKNPEFPDRNFAFGKYFINSGTDKTVYCTEACKVPCEFKEIAQEWR
jgi:hypothetical protein